MKEIPTDVWPQLVASLLAVNSYSLLRARLLVPQLVESSLSEPEEFPSVGEVEVVKRLWRAGYRRGPFMARLMAERLIALGEFVSAKGEPECRAILLGDDSIAIHSLLEPVKGIGPVVIKNFLTLRDLM